MRENLDKEIKDINNIVIKIIDHNELNMESKLRINEIKKATEYKDVSEWNPYKINKLCDLLKSFIVFILFKSSTQSM